jgi:aconitate hydratase
MDPADPWGVTEPLVVAGESFTVYSVDRLSGIDRAGLARRPLTTRILLENLVRHPDPRLADAALVRDLAHGRLSTADLELPFYPSRVLLQDFTGVPVLVDLAAMRSAASKRGLEPERVNPIVPVDLVVDHSVQVDSFGSPHSRLINLDREYERNGERYSLLRWSQAAFHNMRIVPPGNGIVHQVNLEYLAQVVSVRGVNGRVTLVPDTLVGTDSHTTMVNGLGVLGWGVGGIEAEAVALGEPTSPGPLRVVGVKLSGTLPEGATATDAVLTVTRELRRRNVVEKFVEFHGPGVASLAVPDRATIANMCPEYGATAALFPIDEATLAYLRGTGRDPKHVARVEAYARRMGWFLERSSPVPEFDEVVEIDLGAIGAMVSGPRNPEEGVPLARVPSIFETSRAAFRKEHPEPTVPPAPLSRESPGHPYPGDDPLHPFSAGFNHQPESRLANTPEDGAVRDGSVVIAAITSCTNTSNPNVMVGAGLIARRALALGLRVPAYVKTSLAPGSKVVTDYLERAGLLDPLARLGFALVGYGCTTCIGNSGPLPPEVEKAIRDRDAYVAAVLSGNRNFEARIHNLVRANFLASPMLVVAYALAGRVDADLTTSPLGRAADGRPVFLRDLWPTAEEVRRTVESSLSPDMFRAQYARITVGDEHWERLPAPRDANYPWDARSTYLREPPYFAANGRAVAPEAGRLLSGARALAIFGDNVSTDHISPAGEIPPESPAGRYLREQGVAEADFNTYGARRGNHEVMIRGTFANVRIRNRMARGREGGFTLHVPSGTLGTVYETANRYREERVPLVVFAGQRYGQGSSRDWAAKGPMLLGVRAVVAQSYERIHRSNLAGMGVLPLEFTAGDGPAPLGLTGEERFSLAVPDGGQLAPRGPVELEIESDSAPPRKATLRCRIDSPAEMEYYRSGGLLPYVLDRLAARPGRAG